MAPGSVVVADGVDEKTPRVQSRSSWLLVAVAFALGLALGTLASSPTEAPAVAAEEVAEQTIADGPVEPAVDEYEAGVSGRIPEFPDALVAIGDGIGSGHDHLLWPVGGPLVMRSLTGGSNVQLDAIGQFVAMSDGVPGLEGVVLTMGRFNAMRAVSPAVTSYSWHDSSTGQLAFTSEQEGEWRLQLVSGTFFPSTVVSGPVDGPSIAAWGDWGFAIQDEDQISLLNPAGEPKSVQSGVALTSHQSGWLLVEDDGLKMVSAGGGVRRLDLADVPTTVFAAAFSPDGDLAAVAGRFGVIVYDLASEMEIAEIPGFPTGWLAWSSDSRFVIAPAQSGILVHDLETGEVHRALVGHSVVSARALPLSTS
ncbi:MAG TPA: hypothetical protein VK969_04085 [Acidimicrobiia bacterium]|nr:hypothetical protein [Acidimicrobiia bacterium]